MFLSRVGLAFQSLFSTLTGNQAGFYDFAAYESNIVQTLLSYDRPILKQLPYNAGPIAATFRNPTSVTRGGGLVRLKSC
jgi:hypothetical protein